MVIGVKTTNPKRYRFSVNTLYIDGDFIIKRTQYNDRLYIYIYKKSFPFYRNIIGLRVIVNE
jgi:hypothetical protein